MVQLIFFPLSFVCTLGFREAIRKNYLSSNSPNVKTWLSWHQIILKDFWKVKEFCRARGSRIILFCCTMRWWVAARWPRPSPRKPSRPLPPAPQQCRQLRPADGGAQGQLEAHEHGRCPFRLCRFSEYCSQVPVLQSNSWSLHTFEKICSLGLVFVTLGPLLHSSLSAGCWPGWGWAGFPLPHSLGRTERSSFVSFLFLFLKYYTKDCSLVNFLFQT